MGLLYKLTDLFRRMPLMAKILFVVFSIGTLQMWVGPTSRIIYSTPSDYLIAVIVELILIFGSLAIFGYLEANPSSVDWRVQTEEGKIFVTRLLVRGAMLLCIVLMGLKWFRAV